jgi:hypothetical protein
VRTFSIEANDQAIATGKDRLREVSPP